MESMLDNQNLYQPPSAKLETASGEDMTKILVIARRQKALLMGFLAYILVAGLSSSASPGLQPLIPMVMLLIALAIVILISRLTLCLYSLPVAIMIIILSFIPLINLLILLMVNSRANKTIKNAGFRVGLIGANIKDIEGSS